jgi:DNA processing protein
LISQDRVEFIAKLKSLLSVEGIGTNKLLSLFSKFDSFDRILNASPTSLCKVENINITLANRIIKAKHNLQQFIDQTEEEFEKLEKINANILTLWDTEFPSTLKRIYSPPLLIYYSGSLELLNTNCIAIVGTRMPSAYGKLITEKFTKELILNGITIVSGLARGIDSISHSTVISNSGNTIAVTGSGIDVIYPPENKKLFYSICEHGLVLSEYPLGTRPDPQNFPKRNRIISGICLGTLVVETRINGGAIQTARFALDQGREVFAIPGNITSPQSEGTNYLIQRGEAKPVLKTEDILEELNLDNKTNITVNKQAIDLNLFEQKIFDSLSDNPIHIDMLANTTGFSTSDCLIHLLSLEFKGYVKQLPGKMFVKE